jgi:ribosomal protein S12 methylthiotransferase
MKPKSFYLVSLGCAKNTVDSESMASLLTQNGYEPVEKASQASILIVNTCGFIRPAIQESIETLQDLAHKKKDGQMLIAAGCLTQRYSQMVTEQVKGIDGILGTRRWMDIMDLIQRLGREHPAAPLYHIPDAKTIGLDEHGVLRAAVQGGSAYLKIADGCRRPCAFCAIPIIKGTLVSRPLERIVEEARQLQSFGVKELILIAQDTTDYGHDLGMKDGLVTLLKRLLPEIPDIPWVRILYAFPGVVSDSLIELLATEKQLLPYLDMPLQHADPGLLRKMRRPSNMEWVHATLKKMRGAIPDLALRTTFIVGYPGEGDAEFQNLMDFLQEIEFDHVGAFPYFLEPGTFAEPYGDPVPEDVKQSRIERLMLTQQDISLKRNQTFVGKDMNVLVEGYDQGITIGRTYRDAPEIDGLVFIEGKAPIGEIVPAKISGALAHDLTAVLASQPRPKK